MHRVILQCILLCIDRAGVAWFVLCFWGNLLHAWHLKLPGHQESQTSLSQRTFISKVFTLHLVVQQGRQANKPCESHIKRQASIPVKNIL
ncbi:MAG: hypothetical protein ATN36_04680 [Epulopiscium sp. Nele67-Bin005]|nr:MAG: hypothetical protein ATN36_04680 [Epulopiscium sp. Nele67-Bin005]